jgi:hypothetical protein
MLVESLVRGLMFWRVIRILIAFVAACLAAAVALVAFAYAPLDWGSVQADFTGERLSNAAVFAWNATPWIVLSAAAPALAGVAYAEAHKIAGVVFYVTVGFGIAAAGFFLQHTSEGQGGPGIFQAYALIAFLSAGVVGGIVYWSIAGRFAAKPAAAAAKP